MARTKNIRYLMKTELNKMQAYGRSKKADQERTRRERNNAKKHGADSTEYRSIDYTKNHIYSIQTMKNYQQQIDRFADYLKDHNMNKISMEEAANYIQTYLDYLRYEKHHTPDSIHLSCAALCKVFHANMWDYDKPQRTVSNITRGNTHFGADKQATEKTENNRIWQANRILGMRKNELINLRAGMIREVAGRVEIDYIGKGGKHNKQIFYDEAEKVFVLSLKQGKSDGERVFPKKEVKQAANLHKARELRAKDVYAKILGDINSRGETAKKQYEQEIRRIFNGAGKTLKEKLDMPYICRGKNRSRLLSENRSVEYNRVALLMVSLTVTQHFRSDTTANHYVAK